MIRIERGTTLSDDPRVSMGAKTLGVDLSGIPDYGDWRVRDVFTTHNGSWEPKAGDVFTPPQWARTRYLTKSFDDAGADHHIMVRLEDSDGQPVDGPVSFYYNGGIETVFYTGDKPSGWVNMPIFNGGNIGEPGPWIHGPVDKLGGKPGWVKGGHLPMGEHVSLFVVWVYDPNENEPTPSDRIVDVETNGLPTTIRIWNPDNAQITIEYGGTDDPD